MVNLIKLLFKLTVGIMSLE
uniref:Uncharacterized protein n=1 Tax=Arundo donax TaxID=35708 RepID=A0A0A9ANZ9_ARUDO